MRVAKLRSKIPVIAGSRFGFIGVVVIALVLVVVFLKAKLLAVVRSFTIPSDAAIAKTLLKEGTSNIVADTCLNVANDCYDAFHGSIWDEDEDKAVRAVNRLTLASEVQLTCRLYREKFKKSIRDDFENYTFAIDRARVNTIVKQYWS